MSSPIVVTREVAASPAVVYSYLTESTKWSRWQGEDATIEARPGGLVMLKMPNGTTAKGRFVELVPDEKVVLTWGWVDHPGVPPGSTTVEIVISASGNGSRITLTHRGLPPDEVELHTFGWHHYLPRLVTVAAGGDPEPDKGPG